MPNDNTSLDLLAAYLGKKPQDLLNNRPLRNKILQLIYGVTGGGGGGGAVTSVFGRTGIIAASSGDYSAFYSPILTGTTSQYQRGDGSLATFPTNVSTFTNDAGYLTNASSLAWAKITGTPTTVAGYGIADAINPSIQLGTLYNKSTFANTSDFTLVGSPTFTASAGVINVSGGTQGPSAIVGTTNAAYNQAAKITSYGGTMLERWAITYQFSVGITPASTTFGTGIGTYSTNTAGSLSSTIAYFNMSTATGTGTISILAGSSNTTAAISGTALTFSNGDTIQITIERTADTVTASARNITTASSLVACSYTFDTSNANNILVPNSSNFGVVNFGGSYSIKSIKITSNETKNANVMLVGDSKFAGYATAWDARIASQVSQYFPATISCSGPSDRTQDVLNHIAEVIALAPKQVVLCIGRNDIAGSVATGTWEANLSSIVSQLQTAGITVWVVDAIFETSVTQTTLVSYVQTTFPNNYIGLFAPTNAVANVAVDGVHPNFSGATISSNVIRESLTLLDNGVYINGRTSKAGVLNPSFNNIYFYGALVQNPNAQYQPAFAANDIVVVPGACLTSAFGTALQKNRLVISSASTAVMEFRAYTGGIPSNVSFQFLTPRGGATGVQASVLSITQDGNLQVGASPRSFTTGTGDISVAQGCGIRGSSAITAGNEGAFIPFAVTTGATEIRNYLSNGTIKFFTSSGVAGTQLESMDIFASGNIGMGITTDSTSAKLQLKAGTATVAPLTIAAGTNLTTTVAGAIENNGTHLFYTAANAGTRFQLDQQGVAFLASGSAAATATMDINLSNFYNLYSFIEVRFYGVIPATNNVTLQMLVSTDGTTFDNGAGNYQWDIGFTVSGTLGSGLSSTSDTSITISTGVGNTAGQQANGVIRLYNMSNASLRPAMTYEAAIPVNGGTLAIVNGAGEREAAQITKAIRLLMSSGNITGTWRAYGYI